MLSDGGSIPPASTTSRSPDCSQPGLPPPGSEHNAMAAARAALGDHRTIVHAGVALDLTRSPDPAATLLRQFQHLHQVVKGVRPARDIAVG